MALSETGHGRLLLSLLTIAVAVAIQALTNMENDVGYTKRKAEKGNRKGLPRATSEGWLTIQQVDRAILLTAIVVVAISLALVVIGGWGRCLSPPLTFTWAARNRLRIRPGVN